jgi:hypothetical protein
VERASGGRNRNRRRGCRRTWRTRPRDPTKPQSRIVPAARHSRLAAARRSHRRQPISPHDRASRQAEGAYAGFIHEVVGGFCRRVDHHLGVGHDRQAEHSLHASCNASTARVRELVRETGSPRKRTAIPQRSCPTCLLFTEEPTMMPTSRTISWLAITPPVWSSASSVHEATSMWGSREGARARARTYVW